MVLLFQTEFREVIFLDQIHTCQLNLHMGPEIFFFFTAFMPGSEGFDSTLLNKKEIGENKERGK